MRTEEEAVSRLRALAPSAGRLTQRISQKIAFSVHQGSGGWGPSLLATGLVSRPLPHRSLSASNVIRQRKEAALIWDSAWSPPSETWDGKKWEPGERHQALLSHLFCQILSKLFLKICSRLLTPIINHPFSINIDVHP